MHRGGRRLAGLMCLGFVVGCTATQIRYQPSAVIPTEPPAVQATLFLLGDAGAASPERDAVLAHVEQNIDAVADGGAGPPVVVVFLGDNIYEIGARHEYRDEDVAKLRAQVEALGSHQNVQGVLIPGNHDWARGQSDVEGRVAIRLQQDWLAEMSVARNVGLLPRDACPGPATFDVGESLHLVFVDTEWLLRQPPDDCGTAAEFYRRLESDLERNRDRRVVLLAHHPLATGGEHGGNVAPLGRGPFIYYLSAKSGVSVQDLASGTYSDMLKRFEEVFRASGNPPFIHAAGHDHNLQVIRMAGPDQPAYQLVSGSASRSTNARWTDGMRYASNGFGYMRVDFYRSGARVVVYARERTGGPVRPVFSCSLSRAAPDDECPQAPLVGGGR